MTTTALLSSTAPDANINHEILGNRRRRERKVPSYLHIPGLLRYYHSTGRILLSLSRSTARSRALCHLPHQSRSLVFRLSSLLHLTGTPTFFHVSSPPASGYPIETLFALRCANRCIGSWLLLLYHNNDSDTTTPHTHTSPQTHRPIFALIPYHGSFPDPPADDQH